MKTVLKLCLSALVVAALSTSVQVVCAQTFYEGDATGAAGSGSWHVKLEEINPTTFEIVSITANGGAEEPTSDTHHVSLTVFDTYFGGGQNDSGINHGVSVLSTSGTGGVNAAHTNWGVGVMQGIGGGHENIVWNSPPDLLADGSNSFGESTGGDVTTAGGAHRVRILIQDGGQWGIDFQLVPDGASLALILPGLAPVGMLLYRRRKSEAKA